jgi:TP901 family phage tail tape measure protein
MANNDESLDVRVRGIDDLSPALAQIESRLIRFVGAVSSALTAIRVVGFPVTAIRDFEAALAGVQKTTNFTDSQIKSLGDSLVDMSRKINVSAVDLAKIAAAAGQQGLGREGVEGIRQFTESVSRMAAVLDLTAEDAGKSIGKIASVFNIGLKDIESVVSSFNQVSNNSTATGEQLLDVVKRIGNAAGSINLQQAIGLSATGLDLGQSPEVVGTSYAKIFSEMFSQAKAFSKLLGKDINTYIKDLSSNGIQTYKDYLAALRKLKPQDQQKLIKQLSGGGRIGVLVTKGIQDTNDALLNRNLANAQEGKTSGTSAIKEQLTVLKTMDAEAKKLQGSFEALGIKSGEVFGPKLAGYLSQLNTALANPAIVNFAQATGQAFLGLFDTIANGIKFLASLNVNWENFISIAKTVLELKLAAWLFQSLSTVPLLGAALSKLGLDAVRSGEQQAAASAQGATAIQNQVNRIKELIAAYQARKATIAEVAVAEAAAARARQVQLDAETANLKAANKLKNANTNVRNANAPVNAARAGIATAEASAAARVAAVRDQQNAKIAAAEVRHQANLTAIAAEGDKARNLARALGDRASVQLANQLQAQAEAQEKAFQARSLTSINSYYTRRLAVVTAAGAAEVGAAKLQFAQSLSRFDGVVQGQGFGVLTQKARAAAIALEQADAAVVRTAASLTLAQRAAAVAATGFGAVATGVRVLGTAFGLLIGIASKLFFWVSIIYVALDAFGLLDNLPSFFQTFTDKLGLTSETSRRAAQEQKNLADKLAEVKRAADEATAALDKYINKTTGLIDDGTISQIKIGLKDEDVNVQSKNLDLLVSLVEGAYAKLDSVSKAKGALPGLQENTRKELDDTQKLIEAKQKEIKDAIESNLANQRFAGVDGGISAIDTRPLNNQLADLKLKAQDLQKTLTAASNEAINAISNSGAKGQENLNKLKDLVSQVFTQQSAAGFSEFIPKYIDASKKLQEAQKAQAESQKAYEDARGTAQEERLKAVALADIDLLAGAKAVVDQVQQDLGAFIVKAKAEGGLSDAIIGSLDALPLFLKNSLPQLQNLLNVVNSIRNGAGSAPNGGFSGTLAPPPAKPTSGTGTAPDLKNGDAEARALSKARVELARAGLQAEANLQKEFNSQRQAELEHSYGDGLKTIKGYYAQRLALQQQNLDIESRLKTDEIAALNKELGEADQESSRVRVQAQIVKAQGDLKQISAQRKGLVDQTNRDVADARREFNQTVFDKRNSLIEYFGTFNDEEAFQASLDAASASYEIFVQKLRTEAADQPELLKFADLIELQGKFTAVESAIKNIGAEAEINQGKFDLMTDRIENLRTAGQLTTAEAEVANQALRNSIIKVKEAELARSQVQLDKLYDGTKSIDEQSIAYQKLALSIAQGQGALDKLRLQSNKVAEGINNDLKESFSSLFTDFVNSGDITEAVTGFVKNVVNAIAQAAADGLAENIVGMLGSVGNGGVGGFFASLFGQGQNATDALKGTDAMPLVTRPWAGGLGDQVQDTGESLIEKGLDSVVGGTRDLGKDVLGGLDKVTSGIGGFLETGINGLIGFLGPLFTALISAVGLSGSSSAASSGIAAAGAAAAAAHNGGIAGRFTMSKNGIGTLGNGVHYHTGGLVGLAPDEVSAVLRKGEEVITEEDPRHRNNGGLDKNPSQGNTPSVRVVPVLDPSTIHDAMSSSDGEQVIVTILKKRASTVKQLLNIKG